LWEEELTMRFYTGVGSRRTPEEVLEAMTTLARRLFLNDWWLRSGHALGADRAFEAGAAKNKYIYLPKGDAPIRVEAYTLAATIHPAWDLCSQYARDCHARNCYQVLGRGLDSPSKFVVCWTPCGAETEEDTTRATGGTRTAIVLAHREGIPVYNLFNDGAMERLLEEQGLEHA
jgi:hypothetical protein